MCKRQNFIALLIFLWFLMAGGCGRMESAPSVLHKVNVFRPNASGDIAFYIDWENVTNDRSIDSLILSVTCSPGGERFRYRVLETDAVMPGKHNSTNIYLMAEYDLPAPEITSLEVSLAQVNFTNGTAWEGDKQPVIFAQIDGDKGGGDFPVRVNEVLFYDEAANPAFDIPTRFQIDWTNISVKNDIIGIIYRVTVKSADGNVISYNGMDAFYIFDYYNDSSEWIPPASENRDFNKDLSSYSYGLRQEGAAIYEVSVWKAIDSEGVVWENTDEGNVIKAVVCGKKEYAFGDYSSNESIRELVDRIEKEAKKNGLELKEPQIFVRNREYCVLRFDNVDVRVALSDANEVLADRVVFIYYARVTQELEINLFYDMMKLLRISICAAVLTELPYTDVVEKVNEYNNNNADRIDFDDSDYNTFEEHVKILDEYADLINCGVFAAGRYLDNPVEGLFWVRESPYNSEIK
ncbi:MAG: hypothetical protein K2N73_07835 [Lachnospiraceae bacterium]|nr:hypothetical protein [Lachnospiraceae bacterium]